MSRAEPAAERYIAEPRSGPDRRAHPRETLFTVAMLVVADGNTRACTLVDRSLGGVRVRLEPWDDLPDRFQLIDLLSGLAYDLETVWRAPPEAGARRLRTYDLRRPDSVAGCRLQAAWHRATA